MKEYYAEGWNKSFEHAWRSAEEKQYAQLDWCILYALGIGIDQSQLYRSRDGFTLCAREWQGRENVELATVRRAPFAFDSHVEFDDLFAAELLDQAYGDPKIEHIYTTEHDDQLLGAPEDLRTKHVKF